jgi:flagellar motor protein MotB
MSELSNALQGKLNSRKGHVKDPTERQLDLFSSLSDRAISEPKIVLSKPEVSPASARPEPELVLPPAGNPPDVSADVRAVLSESGPARPVEPPQSTGESSLRTGIYQRPRRSAAPAPTPARSAPKSAPAKRLPPFQQLRDWFAGVELDRRLISLVAVLSVLVGVIAFWTARNQKDKEAEPVGPAPVDESQPILQAVSVAAPALPASTPAPAALAAAQPSSAAPAAADWKIPGTETTMNGGATLVRFVDPVFVSADKISVEGWAALKALAAKLVALNAGARVIVTGYTDNEPLTKPTPQFKSNADIAAARAKVAVEHLGQFARSGKGLVFEAQTGEPAQAPYPNDTPQNRRLNRTVTVQVIPAP